MLDRIILFVSHECGWRRRAIRSRRSSQESGLRGGEGCDCSLVGKDFLLFDTNGYRLYCNNNGWSPYPPVFPSLCFFSLALRNSQILTPIRR